jgi:hypothetical protein
MIDPDDLVIPSTIAERIRHELVERMHARAVELGRELAPLAVQDPEAFKAAWRERVGHLTLEALTAAVDERRRWAAPRERWRRAQ